MTGITVSRRLIIPLSCALCIGYDDAQIRDCLKRRPRCAGTLNRCLLSEDERNSVIRAIYERQYIIRDE
jgi:hypothetical protein